jgi:ParB-like nuclease domain
MAAKTDPHFHPLADAFPLISGDAFEELVADIHENGLLQPVIMHEGKILDGRNRWRACQRLGIPHTEKKFTGDDAAAYVWSVNAVRRQLTASQKAMAAAKLADAKIGGQPGNTNPSKTNGPRGPFVSPDTTVSDAAKMAGVGRNTIKRAKKVMIDAIPEVVAAVESGELSVTVAERISDLSEQEQMTIMAENAPADLGKVVPDGRQRPPRGPHLTSVPDPEPEAPKGPGRGNVGPKVQLTRMLEASSAEGAKLRSRTWAENREIISELDPELVTGFLKDLRAENRANTQLIKLIELQLKLQLKNEKDQEK